MCLLVAMTINYHIKYKRQEKKSKTRFLSERLEKTRKIIKTRILTEKTSI